ncbi:MAG: SLC26A/SulP transporter family protein [Bdellovibrionales bacterium]|nr:SLC26A/SulP transporter family protein [Ramlibacter sp.]
MQLSSTVPQPLQYKPKTEMAAGLEGALYGLSATLGPLILFSSVLGSVAVAAGFWAVLVTGVVVSALPVLMRGHPSMISGARAASLALYTGLILQLCAPAPGVPLDAARLAVGLGAASLTLLAAGALVVVCGLLRLGNLFRMIPGPVAAGIANGSALIVLWVGLRQLINSSWLASFDAAVMVGCYAGWFWLQARRPALGRIPSVLVALAAGAAAVALTESGAAHSLSLSVLDGWRWSGALLWPAAGGSDWQRLLVLGVPGAATLALVITLESFTTAAAMELRFGMRIQHNREMVVLGLTNMASAVLGGVPASASTARGVPVWLRGGRGPLAAVACVAVTAAIVVVFAPWLLKLPTGIVVGLLVVQAHVVSDPYSRAWLVRMVRTGRALGGGDLGLRLIMAITMIGFFGNLIWASFAGIAISSLAVLRRVSRDMTASWDYLDRYRSRRARSAAEEGLLRRQPRRVAVLRLSGHLFFGNSYRLGQLADEMDRDARAVVIEVSRVVDADESGIVALQRLVKTLIESGRAVVLAGLQAVHSAPLRVSLDALSGLSRQPDLDRALEACEDVVLMGATVIAEPLLAKAAADNRLLEGLSSEDLTAVLMMAEPRTVNRHEWLFHRGEVSDGVWLIEEGFVNVYADLDATSSRLAAFGPGQFVGEMSLVDGKPRSASVRAELPVRALLLTAPALSGLLEHRPEAAMQIMQNLARELSLRVRSTSALLA